MASQTLFGVQCCSQSRSRTTFKVVYCLAREIRKPTPHSPAKASARLPIVLPREIARFDLLIFKGYQGYYFWFTFNLISGGSTSKKRCCEGSTGGPSYIACSKSSYRVHSQQVILFSVKQTGIRVHGCFVFGICFIIGLIS